MKRGKKSASKESPIERIFREEAGRGMTSKERRVLLPTLKKRKKLRGPQ